MHGCRVQIRPAEGHKRQREDAAGKRVAVAARVLNTHRPTHAPPRLHAARAQLCESSTLVDATPQLLRSSLGIRQLLRARAQPVRQAGRRAVQRRLALRVARVHRRPRLQQR
jgi:hypothetical protein